MEKLDWLNTYLDSFVWLLLIAAFVILLSNHIKNDKNG